MDSNFLERVSLCPFIENQVQEGESIMRIAHVHRDSYIGFNDIGDEVTLKLRGNQRMKPSSIVVGDWVVAIENPMASFSTITRVLERSNRIDRLTSSGVTALVSNVDIGFICVSLNENFNESRIFRYLSLLKSSQVQPILLLTKCDLYQKEDLDSLRKELCEKFKVETYCISIEKKYGIESFLSLFKERKTYVLLGSSGVGKSTITNFLLGEEKQKVQKIRESDGKGYHTTVSRSLHLFDHGVIIDTPGMRSMLLSASTDEIDESFTDVSNLIEQCRFSNCSHQNEPDCALRNALESGDLDAQRYKYYLKMRREARYFEAKENNKLYLEQKKKWKQVTKNSRKIR